MLPAGNPAATYNSAIVSVTNADGVRSSGSSTDASAEPTVDSSAAAACDGETNSIGSSPLTVSWCDSNAASTDWSSGMTSAPNLGFGCERRGLNRAGWSPWPCVAPCSAGGAVAAGRRHPHHTPPLTGGSTCESDCVDSASEAWLSRLFSVRLLCRHCVRLRRDGCLRLA